MKKLISFVIVLALSIYQIITWGVCTRLTDQFHFSWLDLQLRLIESIHNDQGISPVIVRAYHNKATGALLDIARIYMKYIDPVFFVSLLGFAVVALALYGVYYFLHNQRKDKKLLYVLIAQFVIPLIVLILHLPIPFLGTLFLLALPSIIFAAFGLDKILSRHNNKYYILGIIALVLLTLWWNSVLIPTALDLCIK